jgi:hypothetical protein
MTDGSAITKHGFRVQTVSIFTALAVVAVILPACHTAQPAMSLDDAKKVTASFGGASFIPPPRTIKDLVWVLTPRYATFNWHTVISEEEHRREYAAVLYWRRGNAARRAGQFAQAIRDFKRAAELVTPEMMISLDLVEEGFEQVELTRPQKALDVAGADTRMSRPGASESGPGTTRTGATISRSTWPWPAPSRTSSTRCCCRAAS